ncbi:hypothetical protein ABPG75_005917 [Micractinium tetrahymenae]
MAPKRGGEPTSPKGGGKKAKKNEITDPPERDSEGRAFFLLKKPVDEGGEAKELEGKKDNTAPFTGLHNHVSKKVMQHMQVGDQVLLYRYNNTRTDAKADPPGITGICEVVKAPYPDPEDEEEGGFLAVDLKLLEVFEEPISAALLKKHKGDKELRSWLFFKKGVSTVFPMSPQQFDIVVNLEEEPAGQGEG